MRNKKGQFIKGHKSGFEDNLKLGHGWNRGITGMKYPNRKSPPSFTEEHRNNISKSHKGHIGYMLGKKHTDKTKKLMSEIHKKNRKKCNFWKGGITKLYASVRNSFKYRQIRLEIFKRDDYICHWCGRRGYKLQAHHLKSFAKIMRENNIKTFKQAMDCNELWDIRNGLTLCEVCHGETDTYLSNQKNRILNEAGGVSPVELAGPAPRPAPQEMGSPQNGQVGASQQPMQPTQ